MSSTKMRLLTLALSVALTLSSGVALSEKGGASSETKAAPASALLAIDQNRATVIERIVNEWGDKLIAAGTGLNHAQLKEMLSAMRADQLLAASLAGSLDGLKAILSSSAPVAVDTKVGTGGVAKTLGDSTDDLVYTPITPCRLFDTRPSQGGLGTPIAGVRRTYGAITPITQQGGPGGCAAAAGATVALIQIGTLTPTGNGLFQAGPQGTPSFPNALILFQPGDQYGATVAMPLNPANGQFDIIEQFATADVYGDLLGYFKAPSNFVQTLWAVVNPDATLARSHSTTGSSKVSTGGYEVDFNRNVTGCVYVATIGNPGGGNPAHGTIVVALRAGTTTGVFVETRDVAGALQDRGFHLIVNC